MKKVTLYSMNNCPYCVKAKGLLTQRGIQYETIMIDNWSDDQWDDFAKKSGMKTLPQVFVDDHLIGGYTQLADVDAKDQLASFKIKNPNQQLARVFNVDRPAPYFALQLNTILKEE